MSFAWTATSVPTARNYSDVAHNGSLLCAIEYGSAVCATSTDGSTWTEHALPSSSSWNAIASNGTVFCAVSYALGTIAATSPDGVTWTARTLPASRNWVGIAWNGTVFCAIADLSGGTTSAATSPDGITWTARTLPTSANWTAIAWNGAVFCAIAQGGTVAATSPDGITWTSRTLPSSGNWTKIAWNGSVFCAIRYDSTAAATSPDGTTWTARTMPSSGWVSISGGTSGLFAALPVAAGTASATSPDGATWTSQTLPASATWQAVHAGHSDFVALSSGSTNAAIAVGQAATILTVDYTDAFVSASSVGAYPGFTLTDSIAASSTFAAELLANLIDRLNATGSIQGNFTLAGNVSDSVQTIDTMRFAWEMLLAESMAVVGDALGTVTKLLALIDAMVATGLAENSLHAFNACVDAMALEGLIRLGFSPDLVDAATLAAAVTNTARLLGDALDSVAATDNASPFLRLSAISTDSVAVSDPVQALLRANADIAESLLLYVSLRIGGSDYVGYALNTDAKAASRHSNTQHDSYATHKRKHYAAGPNGIVEFTGTTDNGDVIPWSLTSFLLDFGTSKHKRCPDAFIGATTDGQLVLKVVSRDAKTNALFEDWYYVERLATNVPGEGRAKVGRGLCSTWWQWKLTSTNGASLALDKIELKPIILDRRT